MLSSQEGAPRRLGLWRFLVAVVGLLLGRVSCGSKHIGKCDGVFNTSYTEASWFEPGLVPVVFITHGRMGSGVTTNTLQRLANGLKTELNVHTEVMSRLPSSADPVEVARKYFRDICADSDKMLSSGWKPTSKIKARLVGFKWKVAPLSSSWERVVSNVLAPNRVRAVFYTRNMLDWYISSGKHDIVALAPHCTTKDCVQKAQSIKICLNVTRMLYYLESYPKNMDAYAAAFDEHGVNYTSATWTDLYAVPDRIERWRYLLRFVGSPAANSLSEQRLQRAIDLQPTTKYDQRATVINYDEVALALKGRFEHLLHGIPRFPRVGAKVLSLANNPECKPSITY